MYVSRAVSTNLGSQSLKREFYFQCTQDRDGFGVGVALSRRTTLGIHQWIYDVKEPSLIDELIPYRSVRINVAE